MKNINIFDWKAYVNKYPDLRKAGINTRQKAWQHWINYGMKEGRSWKNEVVHADKIHEQPNIENNDASKYIDNNKINEQPNTENNDASKYIDNNKINEQPNIENDASKYIDNNKINPIYMNELLEYISDNTTIDIGPYIKNNIKNIPPNHKLNIIYYVDNTCRVSYNTGIERVVRILGKYLSQKTNLFLVKFDINTSKFVDISHEERLHMSNFNGITYNINNLDLNQSNKWFILGELIYPPLIQKVFEEARRNNMKIATIFYDDIPCKLNKYWDLNVVGYFVTYIKYILTSDIIFPISHYSYSRLLVHYYKSTIVKDIYNYIVPCVLPGEFQNVERNNTYNFSTTENKYHILCIGTIEPRKNQISLVEAVKLSKYSHKIKLIFVGRSTNDSYYMRFIKMIEQNINIIYHQNVTDEQLINLYINSHLTVYPSFEEGFGLPICESIWYCRPCICMNSGAMDEIAKNGGCIKIDCTKPDQIAMAIDQFLSDQNLRAQLVHEINNVKIKTWNEYANEVISNIYSFDVMKETYTSKITKNYQLLNSFPKQYPRIIENYITSKNLQPFIHFYNFVSFEDYSKFLQACDVSVQIRISNGGNISGSVIDCLFLNKPVITTDDIVSSLDIKNDSLISVPTTKNSDWVSINEKDGGYSDKLTKKICDHLIEIINRSQEKIDQDNTLANVLYQRTINYPIQLMKCLNLTINSKLAIVTPYPPDKSGVADFTRDMINKLSKFMNYIDIFTDADTSTDTKKNFYRIDDIIHMRQQYDKIIYVIGNSPFHLKIINYLKLFGGACIMHDESLVELYWGRLDKNFCTDREKGYTSLAFDDIINADPFIIHSKILQNIIMKYYNKQTIYIPFCPYNNLQKYEKTVINEFKKNNNIDGDINIVVNGNIIQIKCPLQVIKVCEKLKNAGINAKVYFVGSF